MVYANKIQFTVAYYGRCFVTVRYYTRQTLKSILIKKKCTIPIYCAIDIVEKSIRNKSVNHNCVMLCDELKKKNKI